MTEERRTRRAIPQVDREEDREPIRDDIHAPENRLHRHRTRVDDPFYIPKEVIPDGVSYEWKRKTVFGKPDIAHMTALQDNHWRPVPAARHPQMMPLDQQDGSIEKDGMILMERPLYLSLEAAQEDFDYARGQMQVKEAQLSNTPMGTATRNHPGVKPKIRKGIDAQIIVPKD